MTVQIDELIKAFTDAMTTDNVEEVLTCFADNAVWTLMPTGEAFHGKDEIRKLAERAISGRTHTQELGIHPRCVFVNAEGTNMCWEYVHTGITNKGSWLQEAGSSAGALLDQPIVLICDIEAGKIVALREYLDLLTSLEPDKKRRILS